MSRTGWCADGDRPTFFGNDPNMDFHNACKKGHKPGKKEIECSCWCHTGATKPPKHTSKQIKRNGKTTKKKEALVAA